MKKVNGFKLILWSGESQTVKPDNGNKFLASEYIYIHRGDKQGVTPRQENFYRNLLQLHRLLNFSKNLPVYFTDDEDNNWYLDRGCVKMAVNSGFLEELKDNEAIKCVTEISLSKIGLNWIEKHLK